MTYLLIVTLNMIEDTRKVYKEMVFVKNSVKNLKYRIHERKRRIELRIVVAKLFFAKMVFYGLCYIYISIRILWDMKTCHNSVLPMHLILYSRHGDILMVYFSIRVLYFITHHKKLKLKKPTRVFKIILAVIMTYMVLKFTFKMHTSCKRMRTDTFDNFYDGYTDNGETPKFMPPNFEERSDKTINLPEVSCVLNMNDYYLCFHYYINEMMHK